MNSNLPNKRGEGQRWRREEGWQREGSRGWKAAVHVHRLPGRGFARGGAGARQKPKLGSKDRSLLYKYITG